MSNLLSTNTAAMKMLFTEDLYIIDKPLPEQVAKPIAEQIPAKVAKPDEEEHMGKKPKNNFKYLGENNKYFLILINDAIHTRINPVHQDMLMKILSAKKFELRDVAIVNINHYHEVQFKELKEFFSCSRLVLFGIDPTKIGMPAMISNKPETKGNTHILATYSLEEMRTNEDKKRDFWNVMKNF